MSTTRKKAIAIEFLDHCEDFHRPLICRAFGEILVDHKEYFVIASWALPEQEGLDYLSREANQKTYTVLKSTIVKKKLFEF